MKLTFITLLVLIGSASLWPLENGRSTGKGRMPFGRSRPGVGRAKVEEPAADPPEEAPEEPAEDDVPEDADGDAEGADTDAEDDTEGEDKAAEENSDAPAEDDENAPGDDAEETANGEAEGDDAAGAGGGDADADGADADGADADGADADGADDMAEADAGGDLNFNVPDPASGKQMAELVITKLKALNKWLAGVVTYWDDLAAGGAATEGEEEDVGLADGSEDNAVEEPEDPVEAGADGPPPPENETNDVAEGGDEVPAEGTDEGAEETQDGENGTEADAEEDAKPAAKPTKPASARGRIGNRRGSPNKNGLKGEEKSGRRRRF